MSRALDRLGSREQTAVNSVDNGLRSDLFAAEKSSIQAFDGVFTTLDAVELQVDIAL